MVGTTGTAQVSHAERLSLASGDSEYQEGQEPAKKRRERAPAFPESQALDKAISYVLTTAKQDQCHWPQVTAGGLEAVRSPPSHESVSKSQRF